MSLIDRYIAEVGKHLPRKEHADIEAEIRSTLEDMLEERNQGKGPADEALVIELLKEYGSPREVAMKYGMHQGHQYLIGPHMYPVFEMAVRVLFTIVIAASLLGLGVTLVKTDITGPALLSSLGEWFGGLVSGLIAAFGNIVLVLAIIERTHVAGNFKKEAAEWDPEELKNEPNPDQIDLPDHIFTLIFTFLGLVVINLYPELLAIRYSNDGTLVTLPVLTNAFLRFLPWINIMGLLQISFNVFMLRQKVWKLATRIPGIVLDIASMVLTVIILRTPHIFGFPPDVLTAPGAADSLSRLFDFLPLLIIVIVVITTVVKVVKSLLRIFFDKPQSPFPVIK